MAKQIKTSFIDQLAAISTPTTKKTKGEVSPLDRAKANFTKHANEQINLLETETKTKWFQVTEDGVLISLRNANKPMAFKGSENFIVSDRESAKMFLKTAIDAVQSNEFDDELLRTTRKAKAQS